MRKKIVITGGIGYIGTELCKIYSGISWNNEILVIDNRFVSERVNQLRNWDINFIHKFIFFNFNIVIILWSSLNQSLLEFSFQLF